MINPDGSMDIELDEASTKKLRDFTAELTKLTGRQVQEMEVMNYLVDHMEPEQFKKMR